MYSDMYSNVNTHQWCGLTPSMHDGIILTHSSSTGQFVDLLKGRFALRKDVECQWLLAIVDKSDGFVETVHGDNGKEGTKDLLLLI